MIWGTGRMGANCVMIEDGEDCWFVLYGGGDRVVCGRER